MVNFLLLYHCVIPQRVVTTLYNEPNWFVPTGVKSANDHEKIKIFPNPFNDKITITTWIPLDFQVQIFNSLGALVYSGRTEKGKAEIDLGNQSAGIYFIKAGSYTKKIVKQ